MTQSEQILKVFSERLQRVERTVTELQTATNTADTERAEFKRISTALARDIGLLVRILNGDPDLGHRGLRDELRSLQKERRADVFALQERIERERAASDARLDARLGATERELSRVVTLADSLVLQFKGAEYLLKFLTGTSGITLITIIGVVSRLLGLF